MLKAMDVFVLNIFLIGKNAIINNIENTKNDSRRAIINGCMGIIVDTNFNDIA